MASKRRSGRSNRSGGASPVGDLHTVEAWDGEDWAVRRITGSTSTKPYRCPGCQQTIAPATPHVVAWPLEPSLQEFVATRADTGLGQRRHWHSTCWDARAQRRPRL